MLVTYGGKHESGDTLTDASPIAAAGAIVAPVRRHILTHDMVKLRTRLGHAAGHTLTYRQVTKWLAGHGFAFEGDWLGDDQALCNLQTDEVLTHHERVAGSARQPSDTGNDQAQRPA